MTQLSATGRNYGVFKVGDEMLRQAFAKGEVPERVPVFAQHHEFAARRFGLKQSDFYRDPELLVQAQLDTCADFGIDVATVDFDIYNIEAEAVGQIIVFDDDNMPDVDRSHPLIAEPPDIDALVTPDFATSGRCPDIVRLMDMTAERIGVTPPIAFCAPFSLAANIRGIEALIFDILLNPDFAAELFRRVVDNLVAPWIRHLMDLFPDATTISGADATASVPILSPTMIEEWVMPYIARLRDATHPDLSVPNWIGEAGLKEPLDLMDRKLTVTQHFIEGQDPDVEKLGPDYYVEYADRNDVPLVLGVGASFLALSSPSKVFDRVKHYVRTGMQHDRFALLLCNLGATTPEDNVRAAIAAVHEHGTYQ